MKYTATSVIFYILCVVVPSFAQEDTQREYQLLLNEAQLFQKINASNTQSALIDSAKYYAGHGEFDLATVFLEQYVAQFRPETDMKTQSPNMDQPKSLYWSLHSGIDFNRQEFEVGYIQSDSVLREEINKPYIAAELNKAWVLNDAFSLQAESGLRYDKENSTFSLDGGAGINLQNMVLHLQAGYEMDRNKLYPDFSYRQGSARQSMLWMPSVLTDIQADNIFRYKNYSNPSSAVPSFYHDQFDLTVNYKPSFTSLYQLDYMFDFNESIHYQNNDYSEHILSLSHSRTINKMWQVELKGGYDAHKFVYMLSDSLIRNKAAALFSDIKSRFLLSDNISWETEYQGKWKRYNNKSEQDPDYYWQRLETLFRGGIWHDLIVQAGYDYESKKHFVFSSAVKEYIEEQNYFGHGITFSVEYSNLNSYLLSLNAIYSWRRYPDAHSDNIINLYANRNILNFNLIAQIPLWKGIFFNIFASYDNDQDLDSEESNARNSFFSAEFEYRF